MSDTEPTADIVAADEAVAIEPAEVPTLMMGGTFDIYTTQDGSYHLITYVDGRGREKHTLPAAAVKVLSSENFVARQIRSLLGLSGIEG